MQLTPDGRYLIIEGKSGPRLWRASNPHLEEADREGLVSDLMVAWRAVKDHSANPDALKAARAVVHQAKCGLGERGPVWWTDGSPDLNRRLIRNTDYQIWWDGRSISQAQEPEAQDIQTAMK